LLGILAGLSAKTGANLDEAGANVAQAPQRRQKVSLARESQLENGLGFDNLGTLWKHKPNGF
jgi:hypothetical protein